MVTFGDHGRGDRYFHQFRFDPDALRNKYREERDKRLRQDGNDQYIEVKGDFPAMLMTLMSSRVFPENR